MIYRTGACLMFVVVALLPGCGYVQSDADDDTPPAGSVFVSGKATYEHVPHNANTSGLSYLGEEALPIRGAVVEAVAVSDGQMLDESLTDAQGNYRLTVPEDREMIVRVRAQSRTLTVGPPSWDFQVVDNTNRQAPYLLDSGSFNSSETTTVNLDAESGWSGSAYTSARTAAPFAILDSAYRALQKVLAVDGEAVFSPLLLNWSVNNRPVDGNLADGDIGTTFYSDGEIYVLGAADVDTDEYDGHVIIHEWGHYFEDRLSRADSVGGPHGAGDLLDMRVAYGEGFGNAWSGMVTDDPFYRDSFGAMQADGFAIDVESGQDPDSVGWYSETSVQLVLYDLYDSVNDGADTVGLGLEPLYEVWVGPQRDGVPLTSIFAFTAALKDANPDQVNAVNTLLADQEIFGTDAFGINETNDAGGTPNVLPVYFDPGSAPFTLNNVCSAIPFGEYNTLGNRRFIRFDVLADGGFDITVTGGENPDFILHQAGPIDLGELSNNLPVGQSNEPSSETATGVLLDTGAYVLEVYDFTNVDGDTGSGGEHCYTVTVAIS